MVVLDKKEQPNPEYLTWEYYDQLVLCMINSTLSEEILSHVVGLEISREICGRANHTAVQWYKRFDHTFPSDEIPEAFASMTIGDPHKPA
ncbi:hypothetical protein GIB67_025383 [Kingdonia uniflora]|uniref:Uncharacterized protein n=1 Tax=Kingdonia uniflora TaxID=39325 RepID=A0A7J7NBN7_9MAGN|nr:hypothetical protein GIB67_025383 [Kingdonia uniflora]